MPALPDPAAEASFQRELLREFVELHARVTLRIPLVQALLVGGSAFVLLPQVPLVEFALWAVAVLCMEGARAAHAWHLLRRLSRLDLRKALRQQVALGFLAGAEAGVMLPLFKTDLSALNQTFLTFILVALPAIGVAVSISSRLLAGVYAAAILVPTSTAWVLLHPEHLQATTAMTMAYMLALLFAANENEKLLTRSVAIRRERDEMVRHLERSNEEVQAAVTRAEAAALARTRVLAAASHDLRQPLHALSVYSAILAASPTPATLDEVAAHIDQLVRSLGALLHGLLDLSQLSSGHYVPVRQRFALDAVIASVCAEFEAAAATKGLYFTRELRPVTLESDPTAVLRIARNLIDNAIKYTERGGLRVRLRHDGLCAILVVEDSGRGIAPAEHDRIFEEFYQLGNAGRDRSQGVGLGLAIVERLVVLIGARISLRSRLGAGSRFEVRMPGVHETPPPVAAAVLPPPAAALEATTGGRPTVYLVDDEPDIVRGMTTLLQAWQLEVRAALDAAGTAALFDAGGCPDLLIADLRLRGNEHGPALVARLRELHGEFPVVFITGETSSEALREARATRWPLLHKPVDAQTLRATIESLLAPSART
ncbi:Signal transduction histidine kinase [Variovorax sp. PDC80]|uniref:ATP-binding response regulator n=1 Tax=Variovorax sp. PDC80 TaxID=1882827 RepID=UPI0008EB653E|nr:hybrid sensor histidine kinase/response regulator [Variovorax sp. PDC80]SFO09906.1 Signal transduction histidine kinase [Variovorax sp. PDC80]